jgi:predicted nucleic acid-binding protein
MILVDTSIWVDHLRAADAGLASLLGTGRVLMHPFVVGEIALGHLRKRALILGDLLALPQISTAADFEVMDFVER